NVRPHPVLSSSQHARLTAPSRRTYFLCNHPEAPTIYTLSLHDALPICRLGRSRPTRRVPGCASLPLLDLAEAGAEQVDGGQPPRSEEHTSELQSRVDLVCRLLLEKNKREGVVRVALSAQSARAAELRTV